MKAIIIARDRVSYAQRCVAGLIRAGIEDIYVIDHGSTYRPMLHWLGNLDQRVYAEAGHAQPLSRVHVHWRGDYHPRDLWTNGTLHTIVQPGERFVVTDCDIEPPADPGWLEHLGALLDLNPEAVKAGCGLITDDLPDHYEHADRVRLWEANYQGFNTLRRDRRTGLAWYDASVDTTLALYRDLGPFALDPSVRTADARFMARHLTWYEDSARPEPDIAHYRLHAVAGVSNWLDPDNYAGTHGLGAGR